MKLRLFNAIKKEKAGPFGDANIIDCPPSVYHATWFMSINCILQTGVDIFLEFLILLGILSSTIRFDFLFLAAVSALLASHTLMGLKRRELDVTQDSVQVSMLVEFALLFSDIYFLANYPNLNMSLILLRTPFMILTSLNIAILFYTIFKLKLFRFTFIKKIAATVNINL